MSNNVQVVRYIRDYVWSDGEQDFRPDNMSGITMVYNIDYEAKTVEFSWSVASGVNFSKSLGVSIALKNNQRLKFQLDLVETSGSLRDAVYDNFVYPELKSIDRFWEMSDFEEFRFALNRLNQPFAEKRKAARKKQFEEALFGSEND